MLKFLNKLLGGNKSEKDIAKIKPLIEKAKQFFTQYESLTNDELRGKTAEFKLRIQQHIATISETIAAKKLEADNLPAQDFFA